MADLNPIDDSAAPTQPTEDSQAPDHQASQPLGIFDSEALAPAISDDGLDDLFEGDEEPDLEDDEVLAPTQDSANYNALDSIQDDVDVNAMHDSQYDVALTATQNSVEDTTVRSVEDTVETSSGPGPELESQVDAQNPRSDQDMDMDHREVAPELEEAATGAQDQNQHHAEAHMYETDGDMEDIHQSRNEQEIPCNVDDESLFVPEERVPLPSSRTFSRPSLSPGHSERQSATPHPVERVSASPRHILEQSVSRDGSPATSTRRPVARPAGLLFDRIRAMKEKLGRSSATAHEPPQPAQATLRRPTFLDDLRSHNPAQGGAASFVENKHERAHREALARFEAQEKEFEEIRRRKGKLGFAEDIKLQKIRNAEQMRLQKRKRDQDLAATGDSNPFLDDPASSSRIASPPRRTFASISEAELRSMEVAIQAEEDRPGKKKKAVRVSKGDSEAGRGRGKGKKSKSKASSIGSGKCNKGKRQTAKEKKKAAQDASRLHKSLLYSDVFRQQADEDAPEQPTSSATNKADALKELIASVPIEHKKTAKDDMAALLRATKAFDGRGSCKIDRNGMWKVKGMSSSLKHYQVMGTAFMRERENDFHEPKGGLMADQMGLGKTIMSKYS